MLHMRRPADAAPRRVLAAVLDGAPDGRLRGLRSHRSGPPVRSARRGPAATGNRAAVRLGSGGAVRGVRRCVTGVGGHWGQCVGPRRCVGDSRGDPRCTLTPRHRSAGRRRQHVPLARGHHTRRPTSHQQRASSRCRRLATALLCCHRARGWPAALILKNLLRFSCWDKLRSEVFPSARVHLCRHHNYTDA